MGTVAVAVGDDDTISMLQRIGSACGGWYISRVTNEFVAVDQTGRRCIDQTIAAASDDDFADFGTNDGLRVLHLHQRDRGHRGTHRRVAD